MSVIEQEFDRQEAELEAEIGAVTDRLNAEKEQAKEEVKGLRAKLRKLKRLRREAAELNGGAASGDAPLEDDLGEDPNSDEIDACVEATNELWGTGAEREEAAR